MASLWAPNEQEAQWIYTKGKRSQDEQGIEEISVSFHGTRKDAPGFHNALHQAPLQLSIALTSVELFSSCRVWRNEETHYFSSSCFVFVVVSFSCLVFWQKFFKVASELAVLVSQNLHGNWNKEKLCRQSHCYSLAWHRNARQKPSPTLFRIPSRLRCDSTCSWDSDTMSQSCRIVHILSVP